MCAAPPCGEENWHIELTLGGYLDVITTSYRAETLGALKTVWLILQREWPCPHNGWQWCRGCRRRHRTLPMAGRKTCRAERSAASSWERKGETLAGRPGRARHGNPRTLTVEALNALFRAQEMPKETRDAAEPCSCWDWSWPSRRQRKAQAVVPWPGGSRTCAVEGEVWLSTSVTTCLNGTHAEGLLMCKGSALHHCEWSIFFPKKRTPFLWNSLPHLCHRLGEKQSQESHNISIRANQNPTSGTTCPTLY